MGVAMGRCQSGAASQCNRGATTHMGRRTLGTHKKSHPQIQCKDCYCIIKFVDPNVPTKIKKNSFDHCMYIASCFTQYSESPLYTHS